MYVNKLHNHLMYWRHQCDLAEQHGDDAHLIWSIKVCKSIARKIRTLYPGLNTYAF